MNTTTIHTELQATFSELINLVAAIGRDQINVIPFEGSWSAGQLAQHIVLSGSGFIQLLNGPVKETSKDPDELNEKFKKDFLDFNTKMKSPDFIVPPEINYDQEELTGALNSIQASILIAVKTLDLSKTCVAFELPSIGFLTRSEAISFTLYHTQRHIHQLKNILEKLAALKKQAAE